MISTHWLHFSRTFLFVFRGFGWIVCIWVCMTKVGGGFDTFSTWIPSDWNTTMGEWGWKVWKNKEMNIHIKLTGDCWSCIDRKNHPLEKALSSPKLISTSTDSVEAKYADRSPQTRENFLSCQNMNYTPEYIFLFWSIPSRFAILLHPSINHLSSKAPLFLTHVTPSPIYIFFMLYTPL